jgi:uncharacterized protein (DUF736 family)
MIGLFITKAAVVIVGIVISVMMFKSVRKSFGPEYRIKIITKRTGSGYEYYAKEGNKWVHNTNDYPNITTPLRGVFPYTSAFSTKRELMNFLKLEYIPKRYPSYSTESYASALRMERKQSERWEKQWNGEEVFNRAEVIRRQIKNLDEKGEVEAAGRLALHLEELWAKNPMKQ